MAFDLKENWPIIAAGVVGLGGLYYLMRGSPGGVAVGQTSTAGAEQVAQAQLAAQAQQEGSVSQAFGTYLQYLANKDNNAAAVNIANLQALATEYSQNAQSAAYAEAVQAELAAQQQQIGAAETTSLFGSFWNGLGSIARIFIPQPAPQGG